MAGDDGEPRFVVVDYKTNRLTPRGAVASSDDYAPPGLVKAMAEHHYPLQALLYSVALHRYLRWRQPGYDPAVHLGGVAYLFVRGMVGAATPVTDGMRHGAFTWKVPSDLVVELSDLLAAPGDVLTGVDR
jgi:exodeoxyribonuclease V beta subunit